MNKTLLEKLSHAYRCYYRNRGIRPKLYSVGIQYKDEWYDVMRSMPLYATIDMNKAHSYKDCHMFQGLPIKWTQRARIECLPRRKKLYKRFGLNYSIPQKPMAGGLPIGTVFIV